ncbi:MAG: AbrB/MazE/SpoVT family DNA-binding domain-containing protein [Candidatus Thermoplasmatota archaeon]|nr:AbrB/MazE/SpoVT family DNA-binding domain-containing protein [Candidatus Thermoplasmatota archaeon]
MALTRKVRNIGSSFMIAVPAQLAAMVGIEAGDEYGA